MSESAEADLWQAVLYQCLSDLEIAEPRPGTREAAKRASQAVREARRVRAEAEKFFTEEYGAWAHHREAICAIAGVDERALREQARKIIAGEATLRTVAVTQAGVWGGTVSYGRRAR